MGNSEKESLANQIKREIIVRREAQIEVQEAFQYYQDKSEGLALSLCVHLMLLYNQSDEIPSLIKLFTRKHDGFY